MRHYIAIVEDAGPASAIGVWFPDLPGCFAAGDTVEIRDHIVALVPARHPAEAAE